jgi:hypothetical protein
LLGLAIDDYAGQFGNFGDPAAIFFPVKFNPQRFTTTFPSAKALLP